MNFEDRVKQIIYALSLLIPRNAIAELRIPRSTEGPQSGIFDEKKKMAETAAGLSSQVPGVYVTINPVKKSSDRQGKEPIGQSSFNG